MNKRNYFLVAIEGGEGAGKSTQVKVIADQLRKLGYSVLTVREPGGSPIAEEIRSILLKSRNSGAESFSPITELFLFLGARAQVFTNLRKQLQSTEDFTIVLFDRSNPSTVAYQYWGRELFRIIPGEVLPHLLSIAITNQDMAFDLIALLDIDPKIGLKRKYESQESEINCIDQESLEFHERVRQGFLRQQRNDIWKLFDASKNVNELTQEILSAIIERAELYKNGTWQRPVI